MNGALKNLGFRCTGCGNCCKDPLLPVTDEDVRRIVQRTGERAADIVRWVDRNSIQMDDEPEAFAMLRQGRRVMVLRHQHGACRYLDEDNRCSIYKFRPLGCRVFPFDPTFSKDGKLRRLKLIQATDCQYELNGSNDPDRIRRNQERYDRATELYYEKVEEWNRQQKQRRRKGLGCQTTAQYLEFLGLFPLAIRRDPAREQHAD